MSKCYFAIYEIESRRVLLGEIRMRIAFTTDALAVEGYASEEYVNRLTYH